MSQSLDKLIAECRSLVAHDKSEALPAILAAVERFVADSTVAVDEVPVLNPPDPIPVGGLEEVLFEDTNLSVVLVDTPPGVAQPPHDHRMPVAIGVYQGIEDHRLYRRRASEGLELHDGLSVGPGQAISLATEAIHAIAAGDQNWCRGIHVYLGPISTIDRSIFHPETFAEERLTLARYEQWCRPLS